MAPPGNRRSGYSRRAHNTIFLSYVAAAVGLMAGGGLLLGSLGGMERLTDLRGLAQDIVSPAAGLVAQGRAGAGDLWASLAGFGASGAEVARLRKEVALARVKAVESAALAQENTHLKALLKLSDDAPKAIAHGWLVASTSGSTRRFATISVGSAQGVASGMPVRAPEGLIGRVLEVGNHSARILLITDTESVVPVRRASDGLPAFATGKGDGTLQLRLLTLGINPLKVGDAFVTSGSGGLYWPGTPIAVVASLTRDGAMARPLGDPAVNDMVAVQPAWAPGNDPTLPPPADPAAAKAAEVKAAKAAKAAAKATAAAAKQAR